MIIEICGMSVNLSQLDFGKKAIIILRVSTVRVMLSKIYAAEVSTAEV